MFANNPLFKIKEMIQEADFDGDGLISYGEFEKMVLSNLDWFNICCYKTFLWITVESLKRVKAITGQKQGNHTIRTVFFITVSK